MANNKVLTIATIVVGIATAGALGAVLTLRMMRGRSPAPDAASVTAVPEPPRSEEPTSTAGTGAAATPAEGTEVFINERELSQDQIAALIQTYGATPPKGRYWYDPRSGLYGFWGYEAAGYIRPGHDFGQVSREASRGNTGVFLNGREINGTEAAFFQRIFGVVYRGHFWLDGSTGNMGVEGNPAVLANLIVAMQHAQGANQGEYHWRDGSGAVVSSQGNCTFAAIPGAPVYSTPGCG